ncbi:MAG: hypothetical protein PWP08_1027 [Methanofollis sp.]|nr:hypothetical protein [Methanofollis sp.]
MKGAESPDEAVSALQAELLLVAIVIILSAMILAYLLLTSGMLSFDPGMAGAPCIFEIVSINHLDEDGQTLKYDSRVTLRYNRTPTSPDIRDPAYLMRQYLGYQEENADRTAWYVKDDLSAQFFRNGEALPSRIPTMEAHEYISTHHYGVQYITGTGSQWCPGGSITIDFTDGTFRPGDNVRVEIYSNTDGRLISADTHTA